MAGSLGSDDGNAAQESSSLAQELDDHLLAPVTLRSIEVHGAKNTRRGLLDNLFQPIIEQAASSRITFGDLLRQLNTANEKLGPTTTTSPPSSTSLLDVPPTDLDISIRVREKSRLQLSAGTDIGNAEGSAYTNAVLRNIFGGAESLSVNASTGTRTRSAYNAVFSSPLLNNPDLRLSLEGLRSSAQKPWASHDEHLTGGTLRLAWLAPNTADTHALTYTSVWRQLTNLTPTASPTTGYLLRLVSELAGWGPLKGDVSFLKSELELSGAVPLLASPTTGEPSGISLGAGFRMGVLYPLPLGYSLTSNTAAPSRINDRFLLGGPTDVRGFKQAGLGPHDGADAVGGDVFAAGGVSLLVPLPRLGRESPLRIQFFANGGRLVAVKNKGKGREVLSGGGVGSEGRGLVLDSRAAFNGVKAAVGELVGDGLPSVAAGVGLVYAHPQARFELNASLPVVQRRGEEARKGLQVGVGISFL
ncbi:surface antigen-domain-containing protein [Bombardia bombarda]|uniref:Surface antigen-domain-containing protein n=1 Tax=Bombardia bombarda TaxID=252184 RepID=A0AA40C946_9PEZI|nr:surface antigen-domain-containing protein [Bombardia bombarda]